MLGNYQKNRRVPIVLISLSTLFLSSLSVAQVLEEVVVTAERRTQNIQEVPLSVAAIGEADIRIGKIANLDDISYKTPGLTYDQFNFGELRVYIRGIGNSSDSAASDPAVGIFLDEVYIGRTGGAGLDLVDIERIEILRGPQGTIVWKKHQRWGNPLC